MMDPWGKGLDSWFIQWHEYFQTQLYYPSETECGDFENCCYLAGFVADSATILDAKTLDWEDIGSIKYHIESWHLKMLARVMLGQWLHHVVNHWGEPIPLAQRHLFLLLFARLAEQMGSVNPPKTLFWGPFEKITLTTNLRADAYGLLESDEITQELMIYADGQVFFQTYQKGNSERVYVKGSMLTHRLSQQQVSNLFTAFEVSFSIYHTRQILSTGAGNWHVKLTGEDGAIWNVQGSIGDVEAMNGKWLSHMLRKYLPFERLVCFDDNYYRPKIMELQFNYKQGERIEQITVSRKLGELTYRQEDDRNKSIQKYTFADEVEQLLDGLPYHHFIKSASESNVEFFEPTVERTYELVLKRENEQDVILTGTFDRDELPLVYGQFISEVRIMIDQNRFGEVFSEPLMRMRKRQITDLIFYKVEFFSSKGYHYLSDDDSIQVGDTVIVPVGFDNHEVEGEVVDKGYYAQAQAPFPIAKTKRIIRKLEDEDFEL